MSKSIQTFLLVIITFSLFTPIANLASVKTKSDTIQKPNFLFIAVDDLNDFVGFMSEEQGNFLQMIYPDPKIRKQITERITPNLNRFAKQSTPFLRAFTASPLCNPSRTALMTGVRNHRTNISRNLINFRDVPELKDLVTLPEYLKANGYYTAGVGKIFHKSTFADNTDWTDSAKSWSKFVMRQTGTGDPQGVNSSYTPADKNFQEPALFRFSPTRQKTEQANDYLNADLIARVMETGSASIQDYESKQQTIELPNDTPFFLAAGIFRPHLPWKAPQEFFDAFPTDEMTGINEELLTKITEDLKDIPTGGSGQTDVQRGDLRRLFDWAESQKLEGGKIQAWRMAIQAYMACIKFSDVAIGRLFDGLEKSKFKDNTITVLWSDHGYHLGSKFHFGKVTMWEPGTRVVLMMKNPLVKQKQGVGVTQPVSLIDVYPTVVSMANLKIPAQVDGNDISGLLTDPNKNLGKPTLSSISGNTTLRTSDWRFTLYRNGDKELFDSKKDPFELVNLAKDKNYSDILQKLEAETNQMLKEKQIIAPEVQNNPIKVSSNPNK